MGNCCGTASKDNFASPGRTLGATPAPAPQSNPARAAVPAGVGSSVAPPKRADTGSGVRGDAGSAAARAAEARAAAADAPKGKLGTALDKQKKMTRSETLEEGSRQELLARAQDANVEALQHN